MIPWNPYDYTQQVHYLSNPLQPGPIYFKTPQKCAIFGVCCEAIPRQINFLVMSQFSLVREPTVLSAWFITILGNIGLGETDAYIHPDNCSGQNKNNYFLWYYAWRTTTGAFCTRFWLLATLSSLQTGVLAWLSRRS